MKLKVGLVALAVGSLGWLAWAIWPVDLDIGLDPGRLIGVGRATVSSATEAVGLTIVVTGVPDLRELGGSPTCFAELDLGSGEARMLTLVTKSGSVSQLLESSATWPDAGRFEAVIAFNSDGEDGGGRDAVSRGQLIAALRAGSPMLRVRVTAPLRHLAVSSWLSLEGMREHLLRQLTS